MSGRDVVTGFTEVSSGRSTCRPRQERARHQKLRSKSGTGNVAKKAENLLVRQGYVKKIRLEA
jgi:hypothetical protein